MDVHVYKTWTGRSMDPVHGPWTTPNFQKEIAPVNMKIYQRSAYEKHSLVFIAYILEDLSPYKWEDHKLVLRYRRSSAFLPPIFSFEHFQIAIRSGKFRFNREDLLPPSPRLLYFIVHKKKPRVHGVAHGPGP